MDPLTFRDSIFSYFRLNPDQIEGSFETLPQKIRSNVDSNKHESRFYSPFLIIFMTLEMSFHSHYDIRIQNFLQTTTTTLTE